MKYNKIVILGITASGKTTLAKKISEILKIKVYHSDDFAYKKKWIMKATQEEVIKKIKEIIKKDKWIIEGVHSKYLLKAIKEADLVISIKVKKGVAFKRALKRFKGKKDKTKEKIKLLFKILYWKRDWYKRCKTYSKGFFEISNKKQIKELLEILK